MENALKQSLENRRTYYNIGNQSPISDIEIRKIIESVLLHTPSAFNSQSSRLVLLLKEQHEKFWDMIFECLKGVIPSERVADTQTKINLFRAGYATVLFYEDQIVVEDLQAKFPLYAANFPVWSEHASAMHQFALWILLEEAGFGVSLQHYNSLADEKIRQTWNLPTTWKLIAEMPFGKSLAAPSEKSYQAVEKRFRVFE